MDGVTALKTQRSGAGRPIARLDRRAFGLRSLAGLEALLAGATSSAAQSGYALDERTRIAHLLRRAGFGVSESEFEEYAALGLQGAVERLLNYEQTPDDVEERVAAYLSAIPDFDMTKTAGIQQWWLLRMALTRRPLLEKTVLFWHGFLVSGISKVGRPPLMLRQNQFFRDHALSDYRTILQGISLDPAMMLYLDAGRSRRAHPNENYARELMELFSTGIGHYTEQDVLEAARAFTGWSVSQEGAPVFNPRAHDSGVKTFLGHTGAFAGSDIVDILVKHPATGRRLARKLFTFFAYEPPDGAVLQPLVEAYAYEGMSIKAMLRALFTSEAFYSAAAYRARVKSPVEFLVGTLRRLEVATNGKGVSYTLEGMGQRLLDPPNVAGWPGGASWLNSGTWLARLNFVNRMVTARYNPERPNHDTAYLDLPGLLEGHGLTTPENVVQYLLDLLVDGHVSPAAQKILLEYAGEGRNPRVTGPLWTDQRWVDERARGLLYLIMAMPEYHLN